MDLQTSNADASKHLSIREAARRLLRCEVSKMIVPLKYSEKAEALILELSDLQPGKIIDPEIETSPELEIIELYERENKVVQLSGGEPEFSVCWVPGNFQSLWEDFSKYAGALSEAGYPGCLNCGGRDAAEPWNEKLRRSEMIKNFD